MTPKAPLSALYYEPHYHGLVAQVAIAFPHGTMGMVLLSSMHGFDGGWTLATTKAVADVQACTLSSSGEEATQSIGHMKYALAASQTGTDANVG
ncbi:hypothetical protein FRB96_009075 [Tulasnella sp. 330]|nr:hypothetical protein FRB96_009075 [Tulasnella sp. 330]KAG8881356.1 hypothetical protein FRB98_004400 [Tulasnella sp. 332]